MDDYGALSFRGLKIQESLYLTEPGEPMQVRRSWRERLWSWPWRPWRATKTIVPQVPSKSFYLIGNDTVLCHPAQVAELRRKVEVDG